MWLNQDNYVIGKKAGCQRCWSTASSIRRQWFMRGSILVDDFLTRKVGGKLGQRKNSKSICREKDFSFHYDNNLYMRKVFLSLWATTNISNRNRTNILTFAQGGEKGPKMSAVSLKKGRKKRMTIQNKFCTKFCTKTRIFSIELNLKKNLKEEKHFSEHFPKTRNYLIFFSIILQ